MSVIGHSPLAGASGAAGGAEATYVDDVFSTFLYEGSASAQTITNGIDLSGEGGMVWLKNRSGSYNHSLYDTERGVKKALYSNLTSAEYTENNSVGTFNSDGFAFAGGGDAGFNTSGSKFVSWTFRKAPGFFDVVTYTGTGSNQTISHSLGSVPGMIMIHCRDGSHDWEVYHRSTGATKSLHLNKTDAQATDSNVWNNDTPTSSTFTIATSSNVNQNGHNYVAYVFAHNEQSFGTNSDEAIIKCGSFTGNTASVDLGFEPQWVMFKRTDSSTGGNWHIYDTMRGFHAPDADDALLYANRSNAESVTSRRINLTSTGFDQTTNLYSGATYIYMAIRRPHKPPEAGTEVFKPLTRTGTGSAGSITGVGFAPDLLINKDRNNAGTSDILFYDKLRSPSKYIKSNSSSIESAGNSAPLLFTNDGLELTTGVRANYSGAAQIDYYLRRAPGVFDMVAYTGTGSTRTITHNLSSAPEMMFFKRRSTSNSWIVYHESAGATHYLMLDQTNAAAAHSSPFNNTDPTSSVFTLGPSSGANGNNETFIAYLFASLNGISKVGSYTGTGSNINVDCGFTAGARFVMIKRTDDVGDWYVFDTARGIVSGNDPYLRFNSSDAETTVRDYIDPLNAGFAVAADPGSPTNVLNQNGASYIFLAIA